MSDENTNILSAVNGRALASLVQLDEKTYIVDAVTGRAIAVIDGYFGGGGKAKVMTTAERMAITPEEGQMIFDSTLGALFVGDGTTVGGIAVGGGEDDVPGYRLVSDGEFLNFNPVQPIVNVTGSSVTLQPDTAYKILATTGAVNVTANPPAANKWGYEGHAEIFVGSVGYVVFDTSKIVLANQLEPDSVNNCTLRFHDGMCYISVEDHLAGYIVVSATGTTSGTLPYGIDTATQEYVAFDATLNRSTIDLSGSTANGEKHIVGNSYADTILTGAVDCGTSKFTVANLSLQNVSVNGGTMTIGDASIPSGSTVSVSGGSLAIEKVTGAGSESVIDLGAQYVVVTAPATVDGCSIWFNGNNGTHIFDCYSTVEFKNVSIDSEQIGYLEARRSDPITISGCRLSNKVYLRPYTSSATVKISGSNSVLGGAVGSGTVTLTSGAILDLTGNTHATPIAPGGGITFASGGATVLYSSGAVSGSYMMDNVTLPAGAELTNTAVVNLGGTTTANCYGSASGVTLANGYFLVSSGGTANSTTVNGNGCQLRVFYGGTANNTTVNSGGYLSVYDSGTADITTVNSGGRNNVSSGGTANNTTVNDGGIQRVLDGGTANEPVISSGGSLVVSSGGSALLVTSNTGATVTVEDGGYITYKE